MTARFVQCEFCHRLGDFQGMFLCPRCRRVICSRCKKEGPLRAGQCAAHTPRPECAQD